MDKQQLRVWALEKALYYLSANQPGGMTAAEVVSTAETFLSFVLADGFPKKL